MKQTEDRLSGCQGKVKELDEISKDMGKKVKNRKEIYRKYRTPSNNQIFQLDAQRKKNGRSMA